MAETAVKFTREHFDAHCAKVQARTETVSQTLHRHITALGWNWLTFETKAHCSKPVFYRIERNEFNTPKLQTLLSICIALKLTERERNDIIARAGLSFTTSTQHLAYKYILDRMDDETLTVLGFNKLLLSLGMRKDDLIGMSKDDDITEYRADCEMKKRYSN